MHRERSHVGTPRRCETHWNTREHPFLEWDTHLHNYSYNPSPQIKWKARKPKNLPLFECNRNRMLIYHIRFKGTKEVPILVNLLGSIILNEWISKGGFILCNIYLSNFGGLFTFTEIGYLKMLCIPSKFLYLWKVFFKKMFILEDFKKCMLIFS